MKNRSFLIPWLFVCIFALASEVSHAAPLKTDADLAHGRIGTWPGALSETLAREKYPDAEFIYLDNVADMAQNLKKGKIDAFSMSSLLVNEFLHSDEPGCEILGDSLGKTHFSFVFAYSERGEKLCAEFNEFLREAKADGRVEAWQKKWFNDNPDDRPYTPPVLTGEKGTLSVVINPLFPPLIYMKDNRVSGYETELFESFCAASGYDYTMQTATFDTAIIGVNTGQYDVGLSAVEYIEERSKRYLHSDPTCSADCVIVVPSDVKSEGNFLASVTKTFSDTLLKEARWKMLAEGMATTLVITFFSVLFGSLLGFLICLLYRERHAAFNKSIDLFSTLLQCMPVVVFLMVFYYIVFGKVNLSGTIVAVIAFSILFALAVFNMLKSGADSVPKGQTEGALALGFSERTAFLKFVLPQATRTFFPVYRAEIINLMKSTAIVGYIAVQDLTKAADIIRARTFDAFSPLIAITVMYLALAWLMQKITGHLLERFNPQRRSAKDILPGVKL